ncbi:uncharacterized protein YqcC (DUF446 family) [Cricetibacter osteomyelitidis]|uniref:Uncharacterized protein YqcC (DUF446 family) n=1 Tax=Cricetibacter osteomyelitidis TaxID=1521931 RepID=A0A4R2TCJ7_9PAST|nr:YqcC family protein [Cricetibacter osteomyelitidis]TCP94818.1 uncharacterized protein YqcC (DUF446 family) [Cricetibacter osteomyelitidis]
MHNQVKQYLNQLQQAMQETTLWQTIPPKEEAFFSQEPFAIDHMTVNEWLQWIFIPRMTALCEAKQPLPQQIAITPYVEEALKEFEHLTKILAPLNEIERLLQET